MVSPGVDESQIKCRFDALAHDAKKALFSTKPKIAYSQPSLGKSSLWCFGYKPKLNCCWAELSGEVLLIWRQTARSCTCVYGEGSICKGPRRRRRTRALTNKCNSTKPCARVRLERVHWNACTAARASACTTARASACVRVPARVRTECPYVQNLSDRRHCTSP